MIRIKLLHAQKNRLIIKLYLNLNQNKTQT